MGWPSTGGYWWELVFNWSSMWVLCRPPRASLRACPCPAAAQGVNGVMQMLAALPAGWAADRHRRDSMLRFGAAVGAAAGMLLGFALALRPTVRWKLEAG